MAGDDVFNENRKWCFVSSVFFFSIFIFISLVSQICISVLRSAKRSVSSSSTYPITSKEPALEYQCVGVYRILFGYMIIPEYFVKRREICKSHVYLEGFIQQGLHLNVSKRVKKEKLNNNNNNTYCKWRVHPHTHDINVTKFHLIF